MVRTSCLLLALTGLGGVLWLPPAAAQTPAPPGAEAKHVPAGADPLPGLPQPPDEPASLFAPAAPAPSDSMPLPLSGPYFEIDPRLDPPELPAPGPFFNLELGFLDPHVKNHVTNQVQIGGNAPNTVQLPSAALDWTVAPRFEVGYRLPSGFGEFVFGYRFLASRGTGTATGLDTLAALSSRLDVNECDLDYASREWSLWPCWDMKWRFGMRLTSMYFDSRAEEPPAAAAAGSGVFAQQTSNRFIGAGPHLGLELARRCDEHGLALVGRIDGWISLGQLRQAFVEQSTNLDANGLPSTGRTAALESQAVPQVNAQVGLRWQPSAWPHTCWFAGYQYEYWWNAGRDSDTTFPASRGELNDQGILLRAELSY